MERISISHTLQTITINFPHFALLNLDRAQMEPRWVPPFGPPRGEDRAQLDDPQYELLPSLSLAVSRCRHLQEVYSTVIQTFRLLPQRFLPSLSLLTSHSRLLQTVYRPILHAPHFLPQLLFPSFQVRRGRQAVLRTAAHPPTPAPRGRCGESQVYDLESAEIWERFARFDQFR